MGELHIQSLRKSFGEAEILRGLDLHIANGEFVVFVGPSGCGKSTLLRCIAGLEEITAGEISISGRRVNDEPPSKRGIAMVFQSYALYPHMTVAENMAFGLRLAGVPKAEREAAVRKAAQTLQIEGLLERRPKALSGGQRQRVAIGRAIVRKPEVFLFDEPLSNLDAALRVQMRVELAQLHHELKTTMIYVTHDQTEAMTLADRIVVIHQGRIEQVGAPLELYWKPANLFVAGFIGSPKMNFIPCSMVRAGADGAVVRLPDGTEVAVAVEATELTEGAALTLGIRPEHLLASPTAEPGLATATVTVSEHLGDRTFLYLRLPEHHESITVSADPMNPLRSGQAAHLSFPADRCYLFDPNGRALPARQA